MRRGSIFKFAFIIVFLIILGILMLIAPFIFSESVAVLYPGGIISGEELKLLIITTVLMLIVVIPVFVLTFIFVWKYRHDNGKAKYDPEWSHSSILEIVWWGIPLVIIVAIAVLTWIKTVQLDPFRPIESEKKPLTIQVVALNWKWLFIYPEEKIASVNFFQIPENTPIRFAITADAPMNTFWIPNLSGQVMAMPKMRTELNLIANKTGTWRGSSGNLSGKGFAGMFFTAKASDEEAFKHWVDSAKQSSNHLDLKEYKKLALPSEYNPVALYTLEKGDLFHWIIMKYMMPMEEESGVEEKQH